MAYTRYNVVRAGDNYTGADGKERTTWETVGTMIHNLEKDSRSLKLFLTGEWYSIFEHTDRDEKPTPVADAAERAADSSRKW